MYDPPEWASVEGYEGIYVVSRYGEVARIPGYVKTKKGNYQRYNGGVLKPYQGQVYLSKDSVVTSYYVKELVALAFIPEFKLGDPLFKICGDSDSLDNLSLDASFYRDDPDWFDIPGYEGLYQIRKDSKVRSVPRYVYCEQYGKVCKIFKPGVVLSSTSDDSGYLHVPLTDKDGCCKNWSVHRLVAITFLPNPDNKCQVNHIDGDTSNNYVDNLEWATASENMQHAKRTGLWNPKYCGRRSAESTGRPVICVDDNNRYFISMNEAARYYNVSADVVSLSLANHRSFGGHLFRDASDVLDAKHS